MEPDRSAVGRTRWVTSRAAPTAAAFALVAVAGCGSADDPVAARAEHFYAALSSGDAASACADLAAEARSSLEQQEGQPCEKAITGQDLPEVTGRPSVKVYGSMAQISFLEETAFLSRFRDGWRLTAVGCTRNAVTDQPYDCAIEVG